MSLAERVGSAVTATSMLQQQTSVSAHASPMISPVHLTAPAPATSTTTDAPVREEAPGHNASENAQHAEPQESKSITAVHNGHSAATAASAHAGTGTRHAASSKAAAPPPEAPARAKVGPAARVSVGSSQAPRRAAATAAAPTTTPHRSTTAPKSRTVAPPTLPTTPAGADAVVAATASSADVHTPIQNDPSGTGEAAHDTEDSPATQAVKAGDRLYKQALAVAEKKIAAAMQVPDGCTFAPQINARSARMSTGPKRVEVLYREAEERRKKAEEAAKAAQVVPECTFTPEINQKSKAQPGGADRLLKLFKDAERMKKAAEQKQKELEPQYTFKPNITPKAQKKRVEGADRHTHLYEAAQLHQAKLDAMRRQAEADAPTFKPTITARASSAPRSGNLAERLHAEAQRTAERKAQLAAQLEEAARKELTFKPQVSETSAKLVGKRQTDADAGSRLYQEAQSLEQKREQLRAQIEAEQGITFKPQISKKSTVAAQHRRASVDGSGQTEGDEDGTDAEGNTRRSLNGSVTGGSSHSIWERLHEERTRRESVQAALQQEAASKELEGCTFKPLIHTSSTKSMTGAPAGAVAAEGATGTEEELSVYARLFYKDMHATKMKEEVMRQMREQAELAQCTFKPSISHRATTPARQQSNVWEYLYSQPTKKDATELDHMKAQTELEGCTFKPAISKRSMSMSHITTEAPVWERLATKPTTTDTASTVEQELAECTFKPQLSSNFQSARSRDGPVFDRLYASAPKPAPTVSRSKSAATLRPSTAGASAGGAAAGGAAPGGGSRRVSGISTARKASPIRSQSAARVKRVGSAATASHGGAAGGAAAQGAIDDELWNDGTARQVQDGSDAEDHSASPSSPAVPYSVSPDVPAQRSPARLAPASPQSRPAPTTTDASDIPAAGEEEN